MLPSTTQKNLFAIIVYLCIPLSGLGVDIYAPSLPHMVSYFRTTDTLIQLTLTAYMLGFGLTQPVAGPITDALGRKAVLIIGIGSYAIIALLITMTTRIHLMLAMRLLQGMSGAFISVPARAIIPDCFNGEEFKHKVSLMTLSWAIGPIIAP